MSVKLRKVGIIGVGHVGAHVAFSLATQGIVDELVLVDINKQKVVSDFKPIRLKELTSPNEQVVSLIPEWRTLWKMNNPADEKWARKHIDTIQQCGFRVYEYPKMGLLLGLDEVKGDLYKNYWTPLYQARHKA